MMSKKVKKTAMLFIMVVIMLGIFITPAMANNSSDTSFTFTFSNSGTYHTGIRKKTDDSSMYMYCQSTSVAGASYTAYAYSNEGSCASNYYRFTAGTAHYIGNYAYENGFAYAGIAAYRNTTYAFTAKGLWSPDSV